jgi:hypothetical protein
MGSSKQSTSATQAQTQSGNIDPYAPSVGTLNNIIGNINGLNPGLSGAQSNAAGQVSNAVGGIPNMLPQANNLAASLASGGPNYQPIVSDAYSKYQDALNPLLTANLDPTKTPGVANALATIQNDVGNSVNGMFAGAGRDLSGMNTQTLARGIAQGEAPLLLGQYNQNVANLQGAANGVFNGGINTANSLSGLQQTQFGNQINGVTNAGNFATASPLSALQAASSAYGIPAQNLAQIEALTLPIAGAGRSYNGVSSGTSQSDTTSTPSVLQDIMGVGGMFSGGSNSAARGILSFL